MKSLSHPLVLAACFVCTLGCLDEASTTGFLKVTSPKPGKFEIYRVERERPLVLVADKIGYFNSNIALKPGSYRILADCSHQSIIIYPGGTRTLRAHTVHFKPNKPHSEKDQFSVSCNQFEESGDKQVFHNRFVLSILSGKRSLLVGSVALNLDLKESTKGTIEFPLGSLTLGMNELGGKQQTAVFFATPKNPVVDVTIAQPSNTRLFLLPGTYMIELNGTSTEVTLKESEDKVIKPGWLHVETPENMDFELAEAIRGRPYYFAVNGQRFYDFDRNIPLLPGATRLSIDRSTETQSLDIESSKVTKISVNYIQIDRGCSPWDWRCLGRNTVHLYREDSPYPFLKSTTDVPIIFAGGEILVEIEGLRGVYKRIAEDDARRTYGVGRVQFTPQYSIRPGRETDLARLESDLNFEGFSLDINLQRATKATLIEGLHKLVVYTGFIGIEGERSKRVIPFRVKQGKTLELNLPVIFPTRDKLPNSITGTRPQANRVTARYEFSWQ